ncbi:MAG: metal-dependent transcriptional regulator [Elusimicrobiota bacterium]
MSEERKFPLPTAEQEDHEEALGLIWKLGEKGLRARADVEASISAVARPGVLSELERTGLVRTEGEIVTLAEEGERRARSVIRRNRLAERLLSDVLDLPREAVEASACRMEHVLSPGVSDAICTLLGHPRFCPHGLPIPRGRCCESSLEHVESLLQPLDRLAEGERGRVAYLMFPESPETQRLLTMGVVPGARLKVEQRSPAFVVKVGESTIAMEHSVAEGIFVRTV